MAKVIARIRGGLGNQLFCYAAARRLALANDAELVLDHVTGFVRDYRYRRQYGLDRFRIAARKATPAERMEPFERYRRGLAKLVSRRCPFDRRRYIEQEGMDFEPRLLSLKVSDTIYLDGFWQGEGYFKDIEQTIRDDLRMPPPVDAKNLGLAEQMRHCEAVAVHMRWHDRPGSKSTPNNMDGAYFERAIEELERNVRQPHYFLFSGEPEASKAIVPFANRRVTYINHNRDQESAYKDLWLMTQCKHLIIANSTFSWWGAWLASYPHKIIIVPAVVRYAGLCYWGFEGLIPPGWIQL